MITRLFNMGLKAWAKGSAKRFMNAASSVEIAQTHRLSAILDACIGTARGKSLGLSEINDYARFADLPITEYEEYQLFVERIMAGEARVLTNDPVTLLEPTSGSASASKLIPYTQGLQREFQEAINTWLWSLYRRHPDLVSGRQYWSISPNSTMSRPESVVPIGFDDDASYLGTVGGAFAKAVWAVPPQVAKISEPELFQIETLSCLLSHADLKLISVWHPSFLTILLDAIPTRWDAIVDGVRRGSTYRKPNPSRADRMSRLGKSATAGDLWPEVALISCWGGSANAAYLDRIRQSFPNAVIQEKGLVATEGITTIPFEGHGNALCVNSHFYEFKDAETGDVHPAWDLESGRRYSVILSTSGGLLRYDTHDLVTVTGHMDSIPLLDFVGRDNVVSDMVGEKLNLDFVQTILGDLFPDALFKTLIPHDGQPPSYVLVVYQDGATVTTEEALETRLRENFHYAHARNLGQLGPVGIHEAADDPTDRFRHVVSDLTGAKLGDVKLQELTCLKGVLTEFLQSSP